MRRLVRRIAVCVVLLAPAWPAAAAPNETAIVEVAPGVFFRKAQTEPVFTGCNQGFVIFKDFVLIIDANFPGQAEHVIAAIRERTDKPIRFVFDTHYHGDHADGNMQYTKLGATIVAQERSQPLFQTKGADGFEGAQKNRAAEYGQLSYEIPSLYFSHKLIFDDGDQRVELVFFGHAHTAGDAVAWLPEHGIVFTGDACVNGPFNYTGDGNTESWIAVLGAIEDLPVKTVCPGHGELGGREVLENQKRWFVELRRAVQAGIEAGKTLDEIKAALDVPFYKEWTGVDAKERTENVEHVHKELTAARKPLEEQKRFGRWQRMPGAEGYGDLDDGAALGTAAADLRYDALAELYLGGDSPQRAMIRRHFAARPDELEAMWRYVRRMARRIAAPDDAAALRRGLAIAAVEGGRCDPRDTIVSLVLLRHGAQRAGIDWTPFFRDIQDCVPTENRPLFETARTQSDADVAATVRAFGS